MSVRTRVYFECKIEVTTQHDYHEVADFTDKHANEPHPPAFQPRVVDIILVIAMSHPLQVQSQADADISKNA